MWAFAIYDNLDKKLFCSRDRFGVKPFCYAICDGYFIFASEIKTIITYFTSLKKPNYNIISNFCRKSLVLQSEETWFEGVMRLLPSHNLSIAVGKSPQIKRYWEYPSKTLDISFDEAKESYYDLFMDAVRLRLRADVPLGTSLSGGVDSPSIIAAMRRYYNGKHHSFTAYSNGEQYGHRDSMPFREDIDASETATVKDINRAFQLDGHLIEVNYEQYVQQLQQLIYQMEAPHPFTTVVPLSQLYAEAGKEVKVILEGQGADELLGGYIPQIFLHYILDLIREGKLLKVLSEIREFRRHYSLRYAFLSFFRSSEIPIYRDIFELSTGRRGIFSEKIKSTKFIKDSPFGSPEFSSRLNKVLLQQHSGVLVNLLHYGDALSMQHSLESRMPFMDYRLVEFVFQLPGSFKVRDGIGKFLHREALRETMAGKHSGFFSPQKLGFHSPMAGLFRSDDADSPVGILLSKRCLDRGLFNEKPLRRQINAVRAGKEHGAFLYRLLGVELWFREWID
jgi:asparagine synthase (glutamine-hydrolysing)